MGDRWMWPRRVGGLALLAAALAPGLERSADAAATLLERASDLNVSAITSTGPIDGDASGTTDFAPFTSTIDAESGSISSPPFASSDASQTSSVTAGLAGANFTGADASGSAEIFTLPGTGTASATANSQSLIRFSIPAGESYTYTLTGSVADDGSNASVNVYLDRIAPTHDTLFDITGDAGPFSSSGTIGAGSYELSGSGLGVALVPGGGQAQFSLDFDLTPVPEPASAGLLLASGARFLARRRRR